MPEIAQEAFAKSTRSSLARAPRPSYCQLARMLREHGVNRLRRVGHSCIRHRPSRNFPGGRLKSNAPSRNTPEAPAEAIPPRPGMALCAALSSLSLCFQRATV